MRIAPLPDLIRRPLDRRRESPTTCPQIRSRVPTVERIRVNARLAEIWSSSPSLLPSSSRASMPSDFDPDEATPKPEPTHPGMTAAEADMELCRHENERLRLQVATLKAVVEEKDRLILQLKRALGGRLR